MKPFQFQLACSVFLLLVACTADPQVTRSTPAPALPTIVKTLPPTPSTSPTPQPTASPHPTLTPNATATTFSIANLPLITVSNAVSLKQLTSVQLPPVFQVVWSPNGELIGAATDDGIYLFNSKTMEMLRHLDVKVKTWYGIEASVQSIAFSPDNILLASANVEGLLVWELASGSVKQTLNTGEEESFTVFSQDGTKLAAVSQNNIRVWQTSDWKLLLDVQVLHLDENTFDAATIGDQMSLYEMAFSPNGNTLATVGNYSGLALWKTASGENIPLFESWWPNIAFSVAFSPDESLLASGNSDGTVRLWDLHSGKTLHMLGKGVELPDRLPILAVNFHPNEPLLASGGVNQELDLWDSDSGQLTWKRETTSSISSVAFNFIGDTLISGELDGQLRVWGIYP